MITATSLLFILGLPAGCSDKDAVDTADDTGVEADTDTDTDTDTDSDSDADADTDSDTDTDTDTDTDSGIDECSAELLALDPADGDELVALDAVITATFTAPVTDEDVIFSLSGPSGGVTGVLTLDSGGESATFVPDAALDYSSTYNATVGVCDFLGSSTFTTLGEPLDATTVDGKTYTLGLSDATWNEPTALGSLLPVLGLDTAYLMLFVDEVDATKEIISFVGALGFDEDMDGVVTQYPCAEAVDFPDADFSKNPNFTAGPGELEMDTDFGTVPLYELYVSGTFDETGESAEMNVTGLLDVRSFEYGTAKGCSIVAAFSIPCEVCPDGEEECVFIDASATVAADPKSVVDPDLNPDKTPGCN